MGYLQIGENRLIIKCREARASTRGMTDRETTAYSQQAFPYSGRMGIRIGTAARAIALKWSGRSSFLSGFGVDAQFAFGGDPVRDSSTEVWSRDRLAQAHQWEGGLWRHPSKKSLVKAGHQLRCCDIIVPRPGSLPSTRGCSLRDHGKHD